MTDMETVRARYPDAELVGWCDGACAVFSREAGKAGDSGYIGWGQTTYNVSSTLAHKQAWADARARIDAKTD